MNSGFRFSLKNPKKMCLECLLFMYLNVFIVAFVQAKIAFRSVATP